MLKMMKNRWVMIKRKMMIPMLKNRSMPRGISAQVFHRDFLGAHRYTTGGGTARSAEGGLRFRSGRCKTGIHWMPCTLRTAVVCRGQPKGEATLPLRCARHTYPILYFAHDKALKSKVSLCTKYVLFIRQHRVLPNRPKARCIHGS